MNVSLSTGTSSSLGQYDIAMQDTSGILLSHQAQDPSLTGNNSEVLLSNQDLRREFFFFVVQFQKTS